jgi:DnaK suppressor protein
LKKQRVKYGRASWLVRHAVLQGQETSTELAEAYMGKMDRRGTIKKAARKGSPKSGESNGARSAAAKATPKGGRHAASARLSSIILPEGYRPSDNEPFMNERHRLYFRNKLVAWKEEIVRQNRETLHVLHEDNAQHADLADRATSETDRALELRARDRQRKLIAKIDAALARIEDGTYGFCEETGEPIGLKRLDARPIATLSLEAQERHERREKVFRED